MTKKNLVAVVMSLIVSLALMTSTTPAQAQAKSVTLKATQSVTSITVGVVPHTATVASHPTVRPVFVASWKIRGMLPSTWQGAGYAPRWENVRECIVKRESHGQYNVRNRSSSAMGAYQFLDRSWRRSLANMIHKQYLRHVPIRLWSRADQDHAFWLVWNNGKGRHNWAGGSYRCW